jgi:hypothetical protein
MVRLLAVFVLFFPLASALADLSPPTGTKYFDPRVRFHGISRLNDYVFFLHYETGNDSRFMLPRTVQVTSDAEFTLKTTERFIRGVQLCAIDKNTYTKMKNENPEAFVNASTPGALAVSVDTPINIGSKFRRRAPLTEYRVSLVDGKLAAELVNAENSSVAPLDTPFSFCAFASAFTLFLTSLGIWFARRRSV